MRGAVQNPSISRSFPLCTPAWSRISPLASYSGGHDSVLEPIWNDPEKLSKFHEFYDVEPELQNHGVGRSGAIRILTYLKANHKFTEIIQKMDIIHSPSECRRLEV